MATRAKADGQTEGSSVGQTDVCTSHSDIINTLNPWQQLISLADDKQKMVRKKFRFRRKIITHASREIKGKEEFPNLSPDFTLKAAQVEL